MSKTKPKSVVGSARRLDTNFGILLAVPSAEPMLNVLLISPMEHYKKAERGSDDWTPQDLHPFAQACALEMNIQCCWIAAERTRKTYSCVYV